MHTRSFQILYNLDVWYHLFHYEDVQCFLNQKWQQQTGSTHWWCERAEYNLDMAEAIRNTNKFMKSMIPKVIFKRVLKMNVIWAFNVKCSQILHQPQN